MRLDRPIDLLTQMIQGLYSAETQLILALPRVAARPFSEALRGSLEQHLQQTMDHARRLEQMADALGVPVCGKPCFGMMGILKEGEEHLGYGGPDQLVDAAIIASCQAVEHYEIAGYRSLRELAQMAGAHEIMELIETTLKEEEDASAQLTEFSQGMLAQSAS